MIAAAANQAFNEHWTTQPLVALICVAISLGNALELLLLISTTFRRRNGLYFWSLAISSFSVLPYSIGFTIEYFEVYPILLGDIMNNIGWIIMVTGQSVVLYSRLGIIYQNTRILRWVLIMIIVDGIVIYITTTVVHYGTYSSSKPFNRASHIVEKIQMTVFSVQEFIISGIYVREVIRYNRIVTQERARRTILELLIINIIIIIFDIALLALEYLGFTILEQAFKGLAYSVKLKMEFAILGKLVAMAKAGAGSPPEGHVDRDGGQFWGSDGARSKSSVQRNSFV